MPDEKETQSSEGQEEVQEPSSEAVSAGTVQEPSSEAEPALQEADATRAEVESIRAELAREKQERTRIQSEKDREIHAAQRRIEEYEQQRRRDEQGREAAREAYENRLLREDPEAYAELMRQTKEERRHEANVAAARDDAKYELGDNLLSMLPQLPVFAGLSKEDRDDAWQTAVTRARAEGFKGGVPIPYVIDALAKCSMAASEQKAAAAEARVKELETKTQALEKELGGIRVKSNGGPETNIPGTSSVWANEDEELLNSNDARRLSEILRKRGVK